MPRAQYRRVMLKMSGQSLQGDAGFGIDQVTVNYVASQICNVRSLGVEIGVVVGGGNIWRGEQASLSGLDRATADYMGMLATVMNALAINADAQRYDHLAYIDALSQGLGVIDSTALSLCMDNNLPIIVFDLTNPENLQRLLEGDEVGTLIS